MTTPTALYLSPSNWEDARAHLLACAAIPCEIGDRALNEIDELDQQIVADLLNLDGTPAEIARDEDCAIDCDSAGRIWLEVYWCDETVSEMTRLPVLPLPLPGSWYDPALDPSNAPAMAPEDRNGVVVVLGAETAQLLEAWLQHQLGRNVRRTPRMEEAIAELHGQLQSVPRG